MTPKAERLSDAVTLYEGAAEDVVPILDDGVIAATVTSPPYNQMTDVGKKPSGTWAKSCGGAGFVKRWAEEGYEDNIDEPQYQIGQNSLFEAIASKSSPTSSLFYNHQIRWRDGECIHPVDWFKPIGWKMRQEIIWNRGGGMMFNARMFVRFDERILWFVRGKTWVWNQESVGWGTIWAIAREQTQQGKLHPVAFPLEIPSRCIRAATNPGETILDPFAGSGTTGIAAMMEGRSCILIEKDARYCEIIRRRVREADGAAPGTLFREVARRESLFADEPEPEVAR